jgi:hypothetical protein
MDSLAEDEGPLPAGIIDPDAAFAVWWNQPRGGPLVPRCHWPSFRHRLSFPRGLHGTPAVVSCSPKVVTDSARARWNLVQIVALVYVAVFVPIRVAWANEPAPFSSVWSATSGHGQRCYSISPCYSFGNFYEWRPMKVKMAPPVLMPTRRTYCVWCLSGSGTYISTEIP